MSENTPEPDKSAVKRSAEMADKAKQAAESVTKVADSANNAFSAIKWVAIAVVLALFTFLGIMAYKIISAPAKAVGNAVEDVTAGVKSGASSVKSGTSDVLNRLVISATDQMRLNTASEASFKAVTDMDAQIPETVKAKLFATKNFPGHENKLCELSMSFGGDAIPVFVAADNKAYATSKSLGSNNDRLLRILVRAPGDDIGVKSEWDEEAGQWVMKWKTTTLKKPLTDTEAEDRVLSILETASADCL